MIDLQQILTGPESETLYGDGEPKWMQGKDQLPAKTAQDALNQRLQYLKLLERHASKDAAAMQVYARLASCTPGQRCLSGACPECHRAFQRWFVGSADSLLQTWDRRLLTISAVPGDIRSPEGDLSPVPFQELRHRLDELFDEGNIRTVLGGFDISCNEHETEGFSAHWRPHVWFLTPPPRFRRFEKRFRAAFPRLGSVRRPVVVRHFDGNRAGLAYSIKGDFQRRVSLRPDRQNGTRRNTRNRFLRANQKVTLLKTLDDLGLIDRLILRRVDVDENQSLIRL